MTLLHELVTRTANQRPDAIAIRDGKQEVSYRALGEAVQAVGRALCALGLERQERVAIFLPKRLETVYSMFGACLAGGVMVPINPVLKAPQVGHIVRDCNARVLITTAERALMLEGELKSSPDLRALVIVDRDSPESTVGVELFGAGFFTAAASRVPHRVIDTDMAAILYTSGSTGKPKGVVLSHRNMVAGAVSVSSYLRNDERDRILCVLPFSFDYGFSQLSTAFLTGASVVLLEYLLPRDILRAAERHQVTGLAAVPPLWVQLAELQWPDAVRSTLRYITNSGGAMPQAVLAKLRAKIPSTSVYLMYGLTEAFRSTFLPPDQVDVRPTSMGKAIPNAEILVVRPDGTPCAPQEPGELVHRGALVSLGYWNDLERTALRFRPVPGSPPELPFQELAVWSGDTVMKDEEGYLYFVGRTDEMIKTSGYRVSPTEVEEVLYATGLVAEAVALGVKHPVLGQAIVVVCVATQANSSERLLPACQSQLPNYMQPHHVAWCASLPRNANGKIDRRGLADEFAGLFDAS